MICGDPMPGGYNAAAHTNPPCIILAVGDACAGEATGCDLTDTPSVSLPDRGCSCNAELICASEAPKAGEGG